nr:immunoglobulin light chain junction region [Macaca mulatta]
DYFCGAWDSSLSTQHIF